MAQETLSDLAAKCIRCGFCLESCPTFVLSGKETESPRGRIYLARTADQGEMPWNQVSESLESCLGCRACETACPSGVEYGSILELAREQTEKTKPKRWRKRLIETTSDHQKFEKQLRLAKLWPGSRMPGFVSKILSGAKPEADLPQSEPLRNWPELNVAALPEIQGDVCLLEGCAMRALFPNVHVATRRLLRRAGYRVLKWDSGCCGALHAHNGFLEEGQKLASNVLSSLPKGIPLIVNSAGCGSHLKDVGGATVFDLTEFLFERNELHQNGAGPESPFLPFREEGVGDGGTTIKSPDTAQSADRVGALPNALPDALPKLRIAYHDACHLAHGQGIRSQPRQLLEGLNGVELVPLPEADMCCGSAGIYNLTQPKIARQLLERKWANIESTGCDIVALANPGCHAWIAQAAREKGSKVKVRHIAEVLECLLSRLEP